MLKMGDQSPDFTLALTSKRPFNLYSTLQNSTVLINFIRGTWCEECTNHLKRVENWRDKLNHKTKKVTTIIITVENENKVREWAAENPTTYLMAADENGSVARLYGFMVPEDAYSKPGLLMIDSNKTIRLISSDLEKSRIEAKNILEI